MDQTEQAVKSLTYRVCSASGTYPAESIQTNSAALLVNESLTVYVWDDSIVDAERILNTSLLLATNLKVGFLKLYGFPFTHSIQSYLSDQLLATIESEIQNKINNKFVTEGDVLPEFDCYQNSKGASMPMLFGGLPYSKSKNLIDREIFNAVSQSLENYPEQSVLQITDLLLTSSKLSCHFQFQSEANYYLLQAIEGYFALDWTKRHPLLIEWEQKANLNCAFASAKNMSPIEYIKIYSALISSLKTSYLEKL